MNSNENNTNFPKEMDKLNTYNSELEKIQNATTNFNNHNNSGIPRNNGFSNLHNRELENSKKLNDYNNGRGNDFSNQTNSNSTSSGSSSNTEESSSRLNSQNLNNKSNINIGNSNSSNSNFGLNKNHFPSNNSKGLSAGRGNLNNKGLKRGNNNSSINSKSSSNFLDRFLSARKKFSSENFGSNFLKRAFLPPILSNSLIDKKDKLEEESEDQGLTNIKIPKKIIVFTAGILVPCFTFVIFLVLIVAASQTYLTANTLGQADSVSDEDAADNIDKVFDVEKKLDEEIDDEVSYVFDLYVDESDQDLDHFEFATKKENELNLSDKSKSIEELKDFYPDIVKYNNDNYDQNDVYRFFTKLYNVYHYYYGKGVKLDMPLLMSVLNLQSSDTAEIFKLNTVGYDKTEMDKGTNNPDFDIDKDWSSYKSTRNNSAHDIEVLAQGMVKEGSSSSESSSDGDYVGDIEFMTGGIGDIYYFNQLDYPNEPYGSYGSIASHGCGPTSLSIVVSSLLKEVHDPIELTNYVCSIGGCSDAGSTWQSITDTPPHYGLQVNRTTNTQEVITALGSGKSLAIAIMCPGHFTSGGHFIVLTASNSNGQVTVADPASRDRSKDWDFNIVAEENCGAYWIINK